MLRSVACLTLLAVTAFGQNSRRVSPPMPPAPPAPVVTPVIGWNPNFDDLKQALSLSDSQVHELRGLQQARNNANQAIYQQISAKQKQLNDLLTAGSTEAAAIGQLEIDMANLRKQTQNGASDQHQALAVLTPDQKAKLASLENALKLQRAATEAVQLGLINYPQIPQPVPVPLASPKLR